MRWEFVMKILSNRKFIIGVLLLLPFLSSLYGIFFLGLKREGFFEISIYCFIVIGVLLFNYFWRPSGEDD